MKLHATFLGAVLVAAGLLQTKAPAYYNFAVSEITDVRQTTTYSRVDLDSGVVFLTSDQWTASKEWLASVFVHEACHLYLYGNGGTATGPAAEATCNSVQYDALVLVGGSEWELQYLAQLNRGL